jgi:hypothetical protein
LNTDSSISEIS